MRNKLTNFLQCGSVAPVYFDTFVCGELVQTVSIILFMDVFPYKKITAHKKAFSFTQEKIIYENFVIQICYIAFSA